MTNGLPIAPSAAMQSSSPDYDLEFVRSYDMDRYGGAFGAYLHSLEVEAFSSLARGGGRLLDLGAGTGKLALELSAGFDAVVCADASFEMLALLRRKAAARGITVYCVLVDAQHLCFPHEVFDCLVSSRMLMHVENWRRAVSELSRVARELVIDFPPLISLPGLVLLTSRVLTGLGAISPRPRAISLAAARLELKRNNHVSLEWRKAFFLPIALHRWLNRPSVSERIERPFRRLGLTMMFGAPVTLRASLISD